MQVRGAARQSGSEDCHQRYVPQASGPPSAPPGAPRPRWQLRRSLLFFKRAFIFCRAPAAGPTPGGPLDCDGLLGGAQMGAER
eukprot:1394748-Pyramimonas_sp.AAC.1